jgi:alpha,alpha-trehalose-phosphate synthase [UDP-forming]
MNEHSVEGIRNNFMVHNTIPTATSSPQQQLKGRNLIVVSNREPFQIQRDQNSLWLERTTGGLVSALDPVLQSCDGLWICWDGVLVNPEEPCFEDLCRLAELNRVKLPYRLATVKLDPEEIEHYYYGFANRQIWPLFHYFPSRYAFDERDWAYYNQVNEKFTRAIVENTTPDDLIWIQDYHLMRVPHLVRKQRPNSHLGFFSHIPFPQYEIFRILPTRVEVLEGMLGSDIIGFHTPSNAKYFMECAEILLPGRAEIRDESTLYFDQRRIQVKAFPISIDFDSIDALARLPQTDEAATVLRQTYQPAELIGLGVDRLDYSKGILDRLECIALFFERYPEYRKRLVFVQIAVPSRTKVQEYQQMKQEIDEAVGRINGRFSEDGWVPIHYLYRGFPIEELVAYYKAADFALINPLRDGMNLVAKEYCAAQSESKGALILSEMAGAAVQLRHSFLVNPYNHPGVVEAIYAAINTPEAEKKRRMTAMRRSIQYANIDHWLQDFLLNFQNAIEHRYPDKQETALANAGL